MPTPERRHTEHQHPEQPSARPRPHAGRQRPAPTSGLAPSPSPLMSVSAPSDPPGSDPPDSQSAGSGAPVPARAGRRQHHRPNGSHPGSPIEDLVYLSGRVPRGLRDELHIRAIGEARPVVELLRDAIRGYLDHPPPSR